MGRVSRRPLRHAASAAGIDIVAVGRLRPGPMRSLVDEYLRRIAWRIDEHEVELAGPADGAVRARREGDLLMAAVPRGSLLISLDPAGTSLSSETFADRLQGWREDGRPVAFAIGGADGHGTAVTRAATARIAFGPMTWPHALVRVMLAEQLWRAYAIVTGHPYHRGEPAPAPGRPGGGHDHR